MTKSSIQEFVEATSQDEQARGSFELENPHLLELNLSGAVWAKLGSMIAYTGAVKFTREGMLEHGMGKMLKRALSGEGTTLMKIEGRGRVYLADRGKRVQLLRLEGETVFVNGNDLLAMEPSLEWDVTMMRRVSGMLAGGLFNIRVSGHGTLAITTHYTPITLRVTPDAPVLTDPNATIAWSGGLTPEIVTDITLKTFLGRGSGESIQLAFRGDGWVVLQPYEEVYGTQPGAS
jgi:uncharacterized protein (AIM24 family)